MLDKLKGWKTVSGLAALIVALLFKDGTIGDGGTVSQVFTYIIGLLGGGMTVGGVISKIKTDATQKTAEAVNRARDNLARQFTETVLPSVISNIVTDTERKELQDLEKEILRKKAEEQMKGYKPNDAGGHEIMGVIHVEGHSDGNPKGKEKSAD